MTIKDHIKKTSNYEEFWTEERCFIREFVNTTTISDFSVAQSRVESSVTTQLHKLSVDEWYTILRGTGLIEIGNRKAQPVQPGDIIEITAGTSQRITNNGNEDLIFLCICRPRFTPDCYDSRED